MPRTKLDRNYICQAADRELKHNPLDRTRSRILEELGMAGSSYYYSIKHGTLTLEAFVKLGRKAGLTDAQFLKVMHSLD